MCRIFFVVLCLSFSITLLSQEPFVIRKDDYDIVEIPKQFGGKDIILVATSLKINRSGCVPVTARVAEGPLAGLYPGYFNPRTGAFVLSSVALGAARDLNSNGFVCGNISGDRSYIWSSKENRVEYFYSGKVEKILRDNTCFTSDRLRIDPEGDVHQLTGNSYLAANRKGEYPNDEWVTQIRKDLGCKALSVTACKSSTEFVLVAYFGNGQPRAYISDGNGHITKLKRPSGIRYSQANAINCKGVIGGSLISTSPPNLPDEQKAVVWYQDNVFVLNDIFGGTYTSVQAINGRGDMLVVHSQPNYLQNAYIFLKKPKP